MGSLNNHRKLWRKSNLVRYLIEVQSRVIPPSTWILVLFDSRFYISIYLSLYKSISCPPGNTSNNDAIIGSLGPWDLRIIRGGRMFALRTGTTSHTLSHVLDSLMIFQVLPLQQVHPNVVHFSVQTAGTRLKTLE